MDTVVVLVAVLGGGSFVAAMALALLSGLSLRALVLLALVPAAVWLAWGVYVELGDEHRDLSPILVGSVRAAFHACAWLLGVAVGWLVRHQWPRRSSPDAS